MVLDEEEIEEFVSEFEDMLRFANKDSKTKSELFKELVNIFTNGYNKWKRIEMEEN